MIAKVPAVRRAFSCEGQTALFFDATMTTMREHAMRTP